MVRKYYLDALQNVSNSGYELGSTVRCVVNTSSKCFSAAAMVSAATPVSRAVSIEDRSDEGSRSDEGVATWERGGGAQSET
jgi:hypothetical protein